MTPSEPGSGRRRAAVFTGTYYTTTDYAWRVLDTIPGKFAGYLLGCGHEVSPAAVRVEQRIIDPHAIGLSTAEREWVRNATMPGPWGPRAVMVTARVSLFVAPLPYPGCGDWMCLDEGSCWTEADAVGEPAVYAGVAAEMVRFRALLEPARLAMMPRALVDEAIAYWRQRADGEPLWTIDVRPRPPGRM